MSTLDVLKRIEELESRIVNLFEGRRDPPRRTPLPSRVETATSEFCPSYCGIYQPTSPGWAKVAASIPFSGEMKSWLTKKGMWSLNGSYTKCSGAVTVTRATCTFGSRKHDSRCNSELKVTHSLGFIHSIEIKLDSENRSHCHEDFEACYKSICKIAGRIDPSMKLLNTLLRFSHNQRPGAILSLALQEILQSNCDDEYRNHILQNINTKKFKKSISRLCSRLRGNRVSSVQEVRGIYDQRKREYRELLRTDKLKAFNYPRIIGLAHSVDENNELKFLCISISTSQMLHFAAVNSQQFSFSTDTTFKRITCGFSLITTGFITHRNHFQLTSISIVQAENTKSYVCAFKHVKAEIEKLTTQPFNPGYLMADCAQSITSAMNIVFPTTKRLVCFAHALRACRLYFRYKCNIRDFEPFRMAMNKIARAKGPDQFRSSVEIFRDSVPEGQARSYVDKKDGLFDVDSWKSKWYDCPYGHYKEVWLPNTNNGCEGNNLRLKELVFNNRILPMSDAIHALLGPEVVRYSLEASSRCEVGQNYQNQSALWNVAKRNLSTVKFLKQDDGIDIYSVGFHEQEDAMTFLEYIPIKSCLRNRGIVYFPSEDFDMNAPPGSGGPFCICPNFSISHVCWHICAAFIIRCPDRVPVSEREVAQRFHPHPSFGTRRPRNPRPALERM